MPSRPPWLQPMRRAERALDDHEIRRILREGRICRVGLCHEDWPYVVPMNYGWSDGRIYLHSADRGTKLRLMECNPRVCFEVTGAAEVVPGTTACDATTRYESVIGWGLVHVVRDEAERRAGLRALLAQHALPEAGLPELLSSSVIVLRIDPGFLSGKSSRQTSVAEAA